MSKICEHCGAKPLVGNMRSHSNRATKRRWNVNLQKTTVEGKAMRLCANCIKTLQKAPR